MLSSGITRTIALCIVAAWAALFGYQLADAFEDAQVQEQPEAVDILFVRTFSAPAETAGLEQAQVGTSTSREEFINESPHLDGHTSLAGDPPLRRSIIPTVVPCPQSRLFQLFSNYRL